MRYNRCGRSGLLLPAISLGLWHNFGGSGDPALKRLLCRRAFDLGITHFDLANNYGPPPGSAEEAFGDIINDDLKAHRDEIVVSTKAGYHMWDGPYGEWGSRKYMLASLDQSLKRMRLPYVDIFYSHRFDPDTPLEETMGALDTAVRSGRALYAGISNYPAAATRKAADILRALGTPCLIHQPCYNMLERAPETEGVFEGAREQGMGIIVFSPLKQGVLSNRYLGGVPSDSRATHGRWFNASMISEDKIKMLRALDGLARSRGQTLAQMALAWVLRGGVVTSALMGASRVEQLDDAVGAVKNLEFSTEELKQIDALTT
jgi:L-glyceraldehyde 3-phosphate reductase